MSDFQQQQQQQQQQPQQPPLVYPITAADPGSQPPNSHHYSNGSFGAVFIVLAVIAVISALACFLSRLCNRGVENQRPEKTTHGGSRPRGKEPKLHPDKEGDIEFGFDLKNPNGKDHKIPPPENGGTKGNGPNGNGNGNCLKPLENGGQMRSEIKRSDHRQVHFNFKSARHI